MPATAAQTFEVKRLRALYSSKPSFKAAFDYFAGRQNNTEKTTVDRLQSLLKQEGQEVSRGDIIELFRALESAQCGQFRIGRKGHPSRFEWSASLISVGQAASGEVSLVEPLAEAEQPVESEDAALGKEIEHRYMLRSDFEVRLALPLDLTSAEASRLADYVRTLPFSK